MSQTEKLPAYFASDLVMISHLGQLEKELYTFILFCGWKLNDSRECVLNGWALMAAVRHLILSTLKKLRLLQLLISFLR